MEEVNVVAKAGNERSGREVGWCWCSETSNHGLVL